MPEETAEQENCAQNDSTDNTEAAILRRRKFHFPIEIPPPIPKAPFVGFHNLTIEYGPALKKKIKSKKTGILLKTV